jgi:hypothetical protein
MTHRKPIPLGHWLWIMATVWLAVGVAVVLRGCGS